MGIAPPQEPVAASAFLHALRNATATAHSMLEDLPLSQSLVSQQVSLRDHAMYLSYMKEVMIVYDHTILPQIESFIPDATQRKKLPALLADLTYLERQGVEIVPAPVVNLPQVAGVAALMGMAYVIEGSTLGGRVIARHLQKKLGLNETNGASFFAGHGENTGKMWTAFLESLTRCAAKGDNAHRVIDGAITGFHMIYTHFSKNSGNEN